MLELPNWLLLRLRWVSDYPTKTLGLPSWVGFITGTIAVILFFWAIYDIFTFRNRGKWVIVWLCVVLLVPLGSIIYFVLGHNQLKKMPEPKLSPKPVAVPKTVTAQTANPAAVPKVYAPPTPPRNDYIFFGGLIAIIVAMAILFSINEAGVRTITYADAQHYVTMSTPFIWGLALIAGAWLAYSVTHPKRIRARSGIASIFLAILGFAFGFVPGFILAAMITYPLSQHACRLSGSKYC